MPYEPYSFPLTGGMQKTIGPLRADPASFFMMQNVRQSRLQRGVLEMTPRFSTATQYTRGTYNTGSGSSTEPSTSAVKYLNSEVVVTEYAVTARGSGTQLKCFKQVTVPTTSGVTGGCLLTIVNPTTTTVNLGSLYEVQIDGAATFRWRVNAGAWTALVAIDAVNGNLIDGGAVRVYWLASTGFTLNDLWQWRRTDYSDATSITTVNQFLTVERSFYYVGTSGRVYKVEYTANGYYVRTVGYRPVYATKLQLYENHLFCLGLLEDLTSTGGPYATCSDLDNLDNFIPTDTNEADVFNFVLVDKNGYLTQQFVLDSVVFQSRLFVLTSSGIYYSDYAGLPVPFSFKFLTTIQSTADAYTPGFMCSTIRGIFIATPIALYRFDGSALSLVLRFNDFIAIGAYYSSPLGLYWVPDINELIVVFAGSSLAYQLDYETVYLRSLSFDSLNRPTALYNSSYLSVGGASRSVYDEDIFYAANSLAYDESNGTGFMVPYFITQAIDGDYMSIVKEAQPVYIVPDLTETVGGSAYATDSEISLSVSFVPFAGVSMGTPTLAGTWTNTKPDGLVGTARLSYRALALKVTFVGKLVPVAPPRAIKIHALETARYVIKSNLPAR